MKKCTGSVSGTLVEAVTLDPLPNVKVEAVALSIDRDDDITDATGAFSFPIPLLGNNNRPITYIVGASAGDNPFALAHLETCGSHDDVVSRRSAGTGRHRGSRPRSGTLEPIEGARVGLPASAPRGRPHPVSVRRQPRRRRSLPARGVSLGFDSGIEDVAVTAGKDGYWVRRSSSRTVEGHAGQKVVADDLLLLRRHHAQIGGFVRNAISGEADPGRER